MKTCCHEDKVNDWNLATDISSALALFENELNIKIRLILLESNCWLSHYNIQLLQIKLQSGPLDSVSQRCFAHGHALFQDCFQCPSHILHRIFTKYDIACERTEQGIDSGICQICSFKLGWGRLWHQGGFKWEGRGHVSLDQRIQLTQAPWKERNLLSEAAGLSIHQSISYSTLLSLKTGSGIQPILPKVNNPVRVTQRHWCPNKKNQLFANHST